MNTISIGDQRPVQKLNPQSLLTQFSNQAMSGCLQIASSGNVWFLHFDAGKLVYASDLTDPFGRLDRHLRQMSLQVLSLVSSVRVQLRLTFETPTAEHSTQDKDYQAICWLVEQRYLKPDQAATLIEALVKEVIAALLPVQSGNYELIEQDLLAEYPKYSQIDLLALLADGEQQKRQRQVDAPSIPLVSERLNFAANSMIPLPKPLAKPLQQPVFPSVPHSSEVLSPAERSLVDAKRVASSGEKTYTIACIDDSPTVLQSINSFLDDRSFAVVLIHDPVKALMQIIRSKPDLILLDVTMPSLDGYELCSLLRKHPNYRHTPVIMVTSNTGLIDRAKAKLVGASGYLTKPFNQSDLLKTVFKYLS